jgi:hypothetical protein
MVLRRRRIGAADRKVFLPAARGRLSASPVASGLHPKRLPWAAPSRRLRSGDVVRPLQGPVSTNEGAASNLKCNTVSYKVLRCTKEPSTSNYNLKSA